MILQDIEFFDFVLDPESQDLLEEQENIKKASIKLTVSKTKAKADEEEGKGLMLKQKKIADGEAYTITKTANAKNSAQIKLDKSLKANETAQFKTKQIIERDNEVKEYRAKKTIDLSNHSKLLTKVAQLKRVPEATQVQIAKLKYGGLSKMTTLSTLFLREGNEPKGIGDNLDEILEGNILSKEIVHPKKKEE